MPTTDMPSAPSERSPLRRWMIDLLRTRPLGPVAAYLTSLAGQDEISRKISTLCQHVPPTVEVVPPAGLADGRRFSMGGAHGLDNVARSLWWGGGWKGYEPPFPDLFAACSIGGRVILDIGAYSGLYSLIAATCSPEARIFAFEPLPAVRRLLEANVRRNGLEDRITVAPVALSDRTGSGTLFVPPTTTGLLESASSLNGGLYNRTLDRVEVPLTTLDAFADERGLDSIDLIKMDVETHEPAVLRGASRVLAGSRPTIFLEILARANTAELEAIRAGSDYVTGLLVAGGVRLLDGVTYSKESANHVLFPREKLAWFRERAERVGCQVTPGA